MQTISNMSYKLIMLLTSLCLLSGNSATASAESSVTFYRDGALFQQDAVAVKGIIEVPLSDGFLENSLNIAPAYGTTITGVEVRKTAQRSKADRDLDALIDQRLRLEDRLQALATREEIFKAAAKSQGGKAPRKTKANPDPMLTIRQGTDFAIAQLESVYAARRKTEQEAVKLDTRIALKKKSNRSAAQSVLVTVTPARGRITLRYATAESAWQPYYNLRLTGEDSALLELSARLTPAANGVRTFVSSGSITKSQLTTGAVQTTGDRALLGSYRLQLTDAQVYSGILNRFSGRITNNGQEYLPPGESGLFRNGAYLGKFRFEGLSSGKSRVISVGKQDS